MAAKVLTADELGAMTPAERRDAFQKSIVADLDQAPPELLARTRARVERIIADADSSQPR